MPDNTDSATAETDPLRLDRCPECGYLLTGLPDQGICPECGTAYHPDMIVLYGWAQHVRGNEATRRHGRRWWVWAVLGWLLILLLFNWIAIIILPAWLISMSAPPSQACSPMPPHPCSLRLVPEGFAQRDGVGPVKLRRWRPNWRQLIFMPAGPGRWSIRSWHHMHIVLCGSRTVDFEFSCDAQTAERIQDRVHMWQSQAAG